jgi:hypothetical protein
LSRSTRASIASPTEQSCARCFVRTAEGTA